MKTVSGRKSSRTYCIKGKGTGLNERNPMMVGLSWKRAQQALGSWERVWKDMGLQVTRTAKRVDAENKAEGTQVHVYAEEEKDAEEKA